MKTQSSRREKIYKLIVGISLVTNVVVLALVFTPVINVLYENLEILPEIQKSDSIILLSSGYHTADIPDHNGFQRMLHALSLYKEGYADKIIICGGVIKDGELPISVIMKNIMVKMGVNESDIIAENLSENTFENLSYALPMLSSLNVKKSLLVTSSSHMFRSLAISRRLGLDVSPAPVPCFEKDINRASQRINFIREILREHLAIAYYWIKGWI